MATIDAKRFRDEMSPLKSYDKDSSRERIKELKKKGIIYVVSQGGLYTSKKRSLKADKENAARLEDNFDVFCSLIEKVPHAQPI